MDRTLLRFANVCRHEPVADGEGLHGRIRQELEIHHVQRARQMMFHAFSLILDNAFVVRDIRPGDGANTAQTGEGGQIQMSAM